MSTAIATISTGKHDEIGQFVDQNLCGGVNTLAAKRLADKALPVERAGLAGRFGDGKKFDSDLITRYPVIDLNSVMAMMHPKKYHGIRPPRFALYNATKGSGVCIFDVEVGNSSASVHFPAQWPESAGKKYAHITTAKHSKRNWRYAIRSAIIAGSIVGLLTGWLAIAVSPWWCFLALGAMIAAVVAGAACEEFCKGQLGDTKISFEARFTGLIPDRIRDEIKDLAVNVFEEVLLAQEVTEWSANVSHDTSQYVSAWERLDSKMEAIFASIDPLVIGVKNGCYYLVERFDTTTLEEYVSREFITHDPESSC
jgi:hypothetical protein